MNGISQGFADVRSRTRQGIAGGWVYSDPTKRTGFGLNAYPQAAQVGTVVVATATNDLLYTVTINGVAASYLADGTTSKIEIAAGLAAAINAEPLIRGQVSAASDGVDTVTLTGLIAGQDFTASDAMAELTTTETTVAAALAASVPFGRAVVWNGYAANETERLVALPSAALFAAQVSTLAVTFVTGSQLTVTVYEDLGGERVQIASVSETSATNLATTLAALLAGLNTALPASSVVVTGGTTDLVFTSEVPGREFALDYSADDGGASIPVFTLTQTEGPSAATSLLRAWQGVSLYSPTDVAAEGSTLGEYGANVGVSYAIQGVVWVESSEAPSAGSTVYVETAAGANAGKFYATASATRVALPRRVARWERDALDATETIAAMRVEAP